MQTIVNWRKGDILLINVVSRISLITAIDEDYLYLYDLKTGNTTKNSVEFIDKQYRAGLFTHYPLGEVDVQVSYR
jgi:hypothetical protein